MYHVMRMGDGSIRRVVLMGAMLALCTPPGADAQVAVDSAAITRFVARARDATARFADRDVAVAESYVKVGPDFPAMGEHWVNGELIMRGELDPARPAILTYTTVDGKPVLTGVVYALALKPGDVPPLLPSGAGWHDHVGSIDEESLLFHHDHHEMDDVRLVVMHAWIWTPNPAGLFTTDNWALPFTRLGLQAPDTVAANAARALSLLAGSGEYYGRLFAKVGALDGAESARCETVVDRASAELRTWWSTRPPSRTLSSAELRQLEAMWRGVTSEILVSVGSAAGERLSRIMKD